MSVLLSEKLAFGLYEADLQTGELWKAGFRVKLQSQPFKVLAALLERPGEIVTREELQQRLWGKDTMVDFDHSLGTAINKIREALGDSAENPRFIETLARRGYRFSAPVRHLSPETRHTGDSQQLPGSRSLDTGTGSVVGEQAPVSPQPSRVSAAMFLPPAAKRRYSVPGLWISALALATVAGVIGFLVGGYRHQTPPHIVQVTHDGHLAPTIATMEDLRPGATDGIHLFASRINNGRSELVSIALHLGTVDALPISDEVAGPALGDISPDGSRLLLRSHLSPESEQPLWVVPTLGGSAQRVGNVLAHDATLMPDGNGVLYAVGTALYLSPLSSGRPELYAKLPGRAFWMRWQPNGEILRFTILDPIAHTTSL